jgi:hypothetical protein
MAVGDIARRYLRVLERIRSTEYEQGALALESACVKDTVTDTSQLPVTLSILYGTWSLVSLFASDTTSTRLQYNERSARTARRVDRSNGMAAASMETETNDMDVDTAPFSGDYSTRRIFHTYTPVSRYCTRGTSYD